ncbi:MAG: hypothetical protein U9R43_07200 [Thermodesulfobacteriota bacterium]|nr:hypothetical protein [Thermodesulfobacteriota bacterium]
MKAVNVHEAKTKLSALLVEVEKTGEGIFILQILPLDLQVCIRSTQLPAIHNDPCNRMIDQRQLFFPVNDN